MGSASPRDKNVQGIPYEWIFPFFLCYEFFKEYLSLFELNHISVTKKLTRIRDS